MIEVADFLVLSVRREGVLDQIVGPDAEEVALAGEVVGRQRPPRGSEDHALVPAEPALRRPRGTGPALGPAPSPRRSAERGCAWGQPRRHGRAHGAGYGRCLAGRMRSGWIARRARDWPPSAASWRREACRGPGRVFESATGGP